MFKNFIGIFKKKKPEDKEKISKENVPEVEKEENDDKQIEEIIKSNSQKSSKNSPAYLLLDTSDESRQIIGQTVKEEMSQILAITLWDKYYQMIKNWE